MYWLATFNISNIESYYYSVDKDKSGNKINNIAMYIRKCIRSWVMEKIVWVWLFFVPRSHTEDFGLKHSSKTSCELHCLKKKTLSMKWFHFIQLSVSFHSYLHWWKLHWIISGKGLSKSLFLFTYRLTRNIYIYIYIYNAFLLNRSILSQCLMGHEIFTQLSSAESIRLAALATARTCSSSNDIPL